MKKTGIQWRVLFFGISIIAASSYFLIPRLLITKSSLIEMRGTINSAICRYDKVYDRKYNENIKATLEIRLNKSSQTFKVSENIGQEYFYDQYETIEKKLNRSDSASIWIAKQQKENFELEIFQISADDKILLKFEYQKYKFYWPTIFMMLWGLFFFWNEISSKLKTL